ncbi:MAG: hypothetical protein AB7O71_19245, partial [Hyphomicrobiaceae bacterium]
NLTDIYARHGNRHFTLVDDIRLPAATIAERVAVYAAANPVSENDGSDAPRRDPETDARLHGRAATRPAPKPGNGS